MTESRKEKLQEMAEPMLKYFKANKEKELTESQLGIKFKLAGNEVRYVISKIVHKLETPNLINIRDKVYILTTKKHYLNSGGRERTKLISLNIAKIKKMIKVA